MPVFKEAIENAPKHLYKTTATDAAAEEKAKQTPGWATLDTDTQQKIVANLSSPKNKTSASDELVQEMTGLLRDFDAWRNNTFDARKLVVVELLAQADSKERVSEIQALVSPTSYRALGKWVESVPEVTVPDAIMKLLAEEAKEATARTAQTKAAASAAHT
ncbi:hypothetical protein [Microbacterium sp. KR10-403]|uniref:hypothetical protein n=1 Tax=Microbacterium sp. KR10-403 TaxID=3158581 RepID=UPI0032E3E1BC